MSGLLKAAGTGDAASIYLLVRDAEVARALTLALRCLHDIAATPVPGVSEIPRVDGAGLIVELGRERDSVGLLRGFLDLAELFLGPRPFPGPVAMFGLEPSLTTRSTLIVPADEGVEYFAIPFDLKEMLGVVSSKQPVAARSNVRQLLRSRIDRATLEAIAAGDAHPIGQFRSLVFATELAAMHRTDAFQPLNPDSRLVGAYFTSRARMARLHFEALRTSADESLGSDVPDERVTDELKKLEDALTALTRVAELVDRASGNLPVPEGAISQLSQQIAVALGDTGGIQGRSVRAVANAWTEGWLRVSRFLTGARQS